MKQKISYELYTGIIIVNYKLTRISAIKKLINNKFLIKYISSIINAIGYLSILTFPMLQHAI